MAGPRALTMRARTLGVAPAALQASYGSYRSTDLNRARIINRDGSGNRHADDYSRRLARELARDQDRSNGVYRALVTTFLDVTLGAGVMPMPTTPDLEWNRKALALFTEDCAALDIEGIDTYGGLQRKWGRAIVNDGDLLLVKVAGGKLSTVEADRVDGRALPGNQYARTISGVRLNAVTGERLAYGVCPYDQQGSYPLIDKVQWYPSDQVIFRGTSSRKSQVRSLPALVAVLDDSERADSLIESSIITAEQASTIWGWIKSATGNSIGGAIDPLANLNPDGTAALGGVPTAGAGTGPVAFQDFTAGVLGMLGNREFQQAQTALPNLNVPEFVRVLMRIFAAELGVPVEMALLDIGQLSWSGNKALQAFMERRLEVWRREVFGPIFSAIYLWRVAQYIADGRLGANPFWRAHDHAWPRSPEADGPDQVTTDKGNLEIGRTSLHRLVGPSWEAVLREQGAELRVRDEEHIKRVIAAHLVIQAAKAANPALANLVLTWQEVVTMGGATTAPGAYLTATGVGDERAAKVKPAGKAEPKADATP
jgi:capsid protein